MAVFSDGGWRTAVRGKWDGGGPVKHHTGGERERAGAGGRAVPRHTARAAWLSRQGKRGTDRWAQGYSALV
jgi:hypothetical protein